MGAEESTLVDIRFGSPLQAIATSEACPPVPAMPAVARTTDAARAEIRHLTASLNHHLRTPLTVLVGHCELLAAHAEALPIEQRVSVHALDEAVRHLSEAVGRVCGLLHEVQFRAHD